jgi:hypothetical protein
VTDASPSAPATALDTELRLLPQQLNLGRAELLTDALTLPFTDIESRLSHYALSSSPDESRRLARSMKSYLGRLNANPHIPLKFRLKVLNRFEQELDLFDAEMTAAVLNAHKIGVLLVQQAARSDSSYYPMLVDMIANAVELAVKLLLMNMARYIAPSVIVTRQFFDLARLGLDVAAAMGERAPSKTARLNKALCNHEMLRKIDLFAHPHTAQQQIWRELQCHVGALTPRFCRSGDSGDNNAHHFYMLINLNRPNDPGRIMRRLPNQIVWDAIVIPLDPLLERLARAIRSVETVLNDPKAQKQTLHTEQALATTLTGGRAILASLKEEKRNHARGQHGEGGVEIDFKLPDAIVRAFSNRQPLDENGEAFDAQRAWSMIDIGPHGACVERIHSDPLDPLPDSLVGLRWRFDRQRLKTRFVPWKEGMDQEQPDAPALGFIRWAKIVKPGEQRIGITFLEPGYQLAKAVVSAGNKRLDDKRTWPVLVRRQQEQSLVIFPDTGVYKQMTFILLMDGQHSHYKITDIPHAGQNYSCCAITRARTSNTA